MTKEESRQSYETERVDTNRLKCTRSFEEVDFADYNFIYQKLDSLYEKGIILLDPMDKVRRENIQKIVKNIPNIVSFLIGTGKSEQLVLSFNPTIHQYIKFTELFRIGHRK